MRETNERARKSGPKRIHLEILGKYALGLSVVGLLCHTGLRVARTEAPYVSASRRKWTRDTRALINPVMSA